MMSNILSVFGASGFVGSEFCKEYVNEVYKEPRTSINPSYTNVVYFISTTDNYNVFTNPELDISTNLIHLIRVLEGSRKNGVKLFTFISSWFVYGECLLPATENSCCKPKGFYSITKKAAEDLVESYCKTYSIDFLILRMSNLYGITDGGVSKKKNALQYIIRELHNGNEVSLYNNGDFLRDYLHVNDAVKAIKIAIESNLRNEIINIGSGKKINFKYLIDIAINELNSLSTIKSIDPPEFHKLIQVKDFYMNVIKITNLGFIPSIQIEDGIVELCRSIK